MEKKDFEGKIGKTFMVKIAENQTVDLELITVDPLKKKQGIPEIEGGIKIREESFSLVFLGSNDERLADNSYTMSVEGWEDQLIFISGFQEDEKGIHYDSVFN